MIKQKTLKSSQSIDYGIECFYHFIKIKLTKFSPCILINHHFLSLHSTQALLHSPEHICLFLLFQFLTFFLLIYKCRVLVTNSQLGLNPLIV